ncbi:hypothetical protein RRG08_061588 [Elysia crispata]|uniref:Uncharacterized protein n=1 Tax=Elysia crispata TaxID=231223 RepID=A0AAE0YSZ9_9GAST|nr:hypothetical protein RRG08_061588 [Elysia crispata]
MEVTTNSKSILLSACNLGHLHYPYQLPDTCTYLQPQPIITTTTTTSSNAILISATATTSSNTNNSITPSRQQHPQLLKFAILNSPPPPPSVWTSQLNETSAPANSRETFLSLISLHPLFSPGEI